MHTYETSTGSTPPTGFAGPQGPPGATAVRSELVDLSDVPLADLRARDPRTYAQALERLLRQVDRPRINLSPGGGDGGPQRFD
ncbi:hypothetical protein [Streptomyces filamentosus]|uniref:hypothetical protein n=1 Tax=Streptomyces filamentosus TaxID=67294 RepID=UPI001238FEF7|nr:hypothetical protein [Streptomyces filamentosus]KAA6217498.1 hypothetical protein CP979_11515 [Streptomyces filamentosus]